MRRARFMQQTAFSLPFVWAGRSLPCFTTHHLPPCLCPVSVRSLLAVVSSAPHAAIQGGFFVSASLLPFSLECVL